MSLERYKNDFEKLIRKGDLLYIAISFDFAPEDAEKAFGEKEEYPNVPVFRTEYQAWYSEAVTCISQIMPARLEDFLVCYRPSKQRKLLDYENYTISDALKGLSRTDGLVTERAGPRAAIHLFQIQLNIVKALAQRFESTLFDIRTLAQADLFDDELDAAEELNKKGFHRGAGALAGVVLEAHLRTVCAQHSVSVPKNAMLGKLNDALKKGDVLDTPTWRFIQHLADLRNLCDHKKSKDPTKEQVEELVEGVRKVTKTVF